MDATLIWAGIERFVPRIATAALMLLLAVLTDPATVGLYAWAMIVLTCVQSSLDYPLRQFGVIVLRAQGGQAKLRRGAYTAVALGALGVGLGVSVLLATVPHKPPGAYALLLLAVHPVLTGAQLPYVARFQNAERWRALARFQTAGVVVGLVVAVPLLLATGSLVAPVVHLLAVELVVLLALARDPLRAEVASTHSQGLREPLRQASVSSLAGWAEGQLDRVAVGVAGGAALLGAYTTAFSAARSPGEAAATGAANALRPKIDVSQTDEQVARALDESLRRSIALACAIVAATWLASETLLPAIMPDAWDAAIATIPIIAITVVPITLSWQLTACCAVRQRMREVLRIRVLGAILALSAGVLALVSLDAVAWGLLGRELVVLALLSWVSRSFVTKDVLVLTFGLTACLVSLELALSALGLL